MWRRRYQILSTKAKRGMQHNIIPGRLLIRVMRNAWAFAPFSPNFSFARASTDFSKALFDELSLSVVLKKSSLSAAGTFAIAASYFARASGGNSSRLKFVFGRRCADLAS